MTPQELMKTALVEQLGQFVLALVESRVEREMLIAKMADLEKTREVPK